MNATTVAIDLVKNVFELAAVDEHWRVIGRARPTRRQLERWFENRSVRLVVVIGGLCHGALMGEDSAGNR